MKILKVAVCLLLIAHCCRYAFMWDKEFLLANILAFSRVVKVEEVYWFITEQLDTKSSKNFQDFFNTIHRNTMVTQMILTTSQDKIIMSKTSCKDRHMGIVMTSGASDPIMNLHNRVLTARHHHSINVVVLVKPLDDFKAAKHLLRSLHQKKYFNTFVYVQHTNGSSKLMKMNRSQKFAIGSGTNLVLNLREELASIRLRNLDCEGCKLYTPVRFDLPGVFGFINNKNVIEEHGISLLILRQFLKHINGSLVNCDDAANNSISSAVDMKDILHLVHSKRILIAAHSYALFSPDEKVGKSSAVSLVKWCLMVPIRSKQSYFYYPIISYQKEVWYAIVLTYIALVITDFLWWWWESRKTPQRNRNLVQEISEKLTTNLCRLLFIAGWKHTKHSCVIRLLLYATVFFHAFFISVGYSSTLGSILAVFLYRNQINTMEDLIKARQPTMIIDYELEFLLKLNMDLPKDFLKLIVAVDPVTFQRHQTSFNQSYAYFVCDNQWKFLRNQQVNLKPKLFKFTNICFGTFSLGFPMEPDSLINYYLEYFMARLQAAGLVIYFREIAFRNAIHAGYVQHFEPNKDYRASSLSHLSMVFFMLIGLSCISITVFLCECLHYRLKKINVKIVTENEVQN